ncbi:uncharacterized protein LOC124361906 [Homalodisca vitripennis]|uniref:uncharacterized protein LOC124361906 n=1 Tax=Homalodisca vitripennis TaxID=197043 RepID=UPI001EEB15FF|nr:uncharacterized protein LOC124361906 [Homalodisca vitripennis]XP_046671922.1 uncharacterized protein LOC124361906 [Homalodisca vitripennis]
MSSRLFALTLLLMSLSGCESVIKVVSEAVVFTNSMGGGEDELQVPSHHTASKLFDAGGEVMEAWWTPLNQITDLSAIYKIDTVPAGRYVKLVVHGKPGHRDARVRIKIYADVLGNDTRC